MYNAEGNKGGLAFSEQDFLIPAGNQRGAAHHYPVLRTVMVFLQRQPLAGLNADALDLKALAVVQGVVVPPGTEYLAMVAVSAAAAPIQLLDDLLHLLR